MPSTRLASPGIPLWLRGSRAGGERRVAPRLALLALAAALGTLPFWLQSQYHLHVAIQVAIFAMLAMSLNLLLGYTGQLSLGHAAFFGIGGYTSALLSKHLDWPVAIGFVVAVVLAGLAGYLIGCLSLRLRGAYFVLVSISFAGVIALVSVNWIELTNGPLGIPNVAPPVLAVPGLGQVVFLRKEPYYYLVLAMAVLSYFVCHRLVRSRFGRACIALRENEVLAQAVGVNATRYLVITAVVSAAMAGAAGSLYVHYTRFVSPEIFLFSYTVTMVIMVVAGGKGTLLGPIVGAVIFTVLPEVLRAVTSYQWQLLLYGVLLVLTVFFLPKGIVPALASWQRRRARPAQVAPAASAPDSRPLAAESRPSTADHRAPTAR
jgi:branched-chain amino acid transport system permease protein